MGQWFAALNASRGDSEVDLMKDDIISAARELLDVACTYRDVNVKHPAFKKLAFTVLRLRSHFGIKPNSSPLWEIIS